MRRSTVSLPSRAVPSYAQNVPGFIGIHLLSITVELLSKLAGSKSGNCGSTDSTAGASVASAVASSVASVKTSVGGSVTLGGTPIAVGLGAHAGAGASIIRNNTTATKTV